MLPFILQRARVGSVTTTDIEHINNLCYVPNPKELNSHPEALWIAPTNKQVTQYNDEAFHNLVNSGASSYRAIAQHAVSSKTHFLNNRNDVEECVLKHLFKTTNVIGTNSK